MDTNTNIAAPLDMTIANQEQIVADAQARLEHEEAVLAALNNVRRMVGESATRAADAAHPAVPVAVPEIPAGAPREAVVTTSASKGPSRKVTPDIDLSGVYVDFEGAGNPLQRMIRLGETLPGQKLNTTQAAQLLIRQGESTGSVHNLSVKLQRHVDENPDLFVRVEEHRATYRYTGGEHRNGTNRNMNVDTGLGASPNGPVQQETRDDHR